MAHIPLGFQAGLLVVKPSQEVFDIVVDVIRKGDYVEGFGRDNGWGGGGYGGFVGAMAMQGLMAYIYDVILYDTWVEINQCRYNHIGMDVLYRSQPSFRSNHPKVGKCRNDRDYCEDCMSTDVSKIYNVHYNQCRKPWNCIGEGSKTRTDKLAIPEDAVHLSHCLELQTIWHKTRSDLEAQLYQLTKDPTILEGSVGNYSRDVFQGHCHAYGGQDYIQLTGSKESFRRIPELYQEQSKQLATTATAA